MSVRSWLAFGVSTTALLSSCAVYAQDAQQEASTSPVAADTVPASPVAGSTVGSADTGDIVVTANKRVQRLNDVGLTVAVVGGEELRNNNISSLADIAVRVPGLTYSNSANGTPIYTLRGVGFIESSLGVYPTVSTYIDEAPLSFPALSAHTAFDLERVEVLKGPQGTLFGQNATGGAINFISAKPTDEFAAGANLSYGRFNQVLGEAYVSGPLTDTINARLAGRIERADGWQISNTRPDDRNGKVRNYMARLLVSYEPTDRVRFLLNLNGWKDRSETQSPQYIAYKLSGPVADPRFAALAFSRETPRAADWNPGLPFRDNRFLQGTLRGDFDLFSNITLTSLTSYVDYKQRQGADNDGVPIAIADLTLDQGRIKSFSQELRLSNGSGQAFRWIVGGNYEKSSVYQSINATFNANSIYYLLSGLGFTTFANDLQYVTDQKFKNYAAFGNVEYDVAPTVTLKAGVRYTNAKARATIFSIDPTGDPTTGTGAFFYYALLGGALGPYTGGPYVINNLGTTVNGTAPGQPGAFAGSLSENNVSYRVGVDWKPSPGILLYGNVSRGYKAGSFPTVSASVFSQYLPVVQESVQAYEVGFKLSPFGRAFQFNGAAFYYDYKNKQLRSKTIDPVFGILDVLQNIPKSSIRGFELEAILRPSRNFTVSTAFTYLDAKIDEFHRNQRWRPGCRLRRHPNPFTPKYQVGVNLDWSEPLTDRLTGFVGSSLNFRSDTTATIEATSIHLIPCQMTSRCLE